VQDAFTRLVVLQKKRLAVISGSNFARSNSGRDVEILNRHWRGSSGVVGARVYFRLALFTIAQR